MPRTIDPESDVRSPARSQSTWLLVLVVVVLVVALVAIVVGALSLRGPSGSGPEATPTAPPAPADLFGPMDIGFAESADNLDDIAKFVPGTSPIIRIMQDWWAIQDSPDSELDFSRLDAKVKSIHDRGWRVLLILGYSPPWANVHDPQYDLPNHDPQTWFPTDDAAWANIVRATVERYADDIQAYEVWNEPNRLAFGKYADNSTPERRDRYWELVKIAYEQVHAACANCVVVAGPSTAPSSGHPEDDPASWLVVGL